MNLDDSMFVNEEDSEELMSDFEVDGIDSGLSYNIIVTDCEEDDFAYEILSSDKIAQCMISCIKAVNTVVQLPPTQIRILLHFFNWDTEKLYERFYGSDQEKLFLDFHLVHPRVKQQLDLTQSSCPQLQRTFSSSSTQLCSSLKETTCEICFLPVPFNSLTGLDCGHTFCLQCWTAYLTTKIMDEGEGQTISCAAFNCNMLVDDTKVMDLIKDPKVKKKYQYLITNSFVQCDKRTRWCPQPNCGLAIRVSYTDRKPVTCACGYVFCFGCGEMWHDPVQCHLLQKWQKKCDDDSETSNWIAANTKECPKCKAIIEKDGGCNHMICKNTSCKNEFCWVCLGPWEPHGTSWYNCNRFDEKESEKARDDQEKSRAALQRYLFHCDRYSNHRQSLKLENKLYASTREKMEEMLQHNMGWVEVQFLKKAVDVLCRCRQTLMFTYVFAFYLTKNNQSIIFEDNQKDLENATEQLSGYLERDIRVDNVTHMKQKVQDKAKYCEHRCTLLLQHVHEGYDNDFWNYQMDL